MSHFFMYISFNISIFITNLFNISKVVFKFSLAIANSYIILLSKLFDKIFPLIIESIFLILSYKNSIFIIFPFFNSNIVVF